MSINMITLVMMFVLSLVLACFASGKRSIGATITLRQAINPDRRRSSLRRHQLPHRAADVFELPVFNRGSIMNGLRSSTLSPLVLSLPRLHIFGREQEMLMYPKFISRQIFSFLFGTFPASILWAINQRYFDGIVTKLWGAK